MISCGTELGAQRLSASTNGSRQPRTHRQQNFPRAQRLSASTNGSRRQRTASVRGTQVLNAFRHQRMDHIANPLLSVAGLKCSTPFGINEWITVAAQNFHFRIGLCSTPFGINEWITSSCGEPIAGTCGCSTPFGINEWITVTPLFSAVFFSCAQRLSASTNGSPE